jgi:hypothetical protein
MKMDELFHEHWQCFFFWQKQNKTKKMEIFILIFLKNSTHEMLFSHTSSHTIY